MRNTENLKKMAASKTDIDFCKKIAGFFKSQKSNFAKTDLVLVLARMGHLLKIYAKFEVNQVIGF